MDFITTLATIFSVIGGLSLVPQTLKIYRNKSATDISLTTFSIMFFGGFFGTFYGMTISSVPVMVGNILASINAFFILLGKLRYLHN